MKVTIEVEVTRGRIADLLCTGMEGGVGYWARIIDWVKPPKDADLHAIGDHWEKDTVYRHIHYPMCEAGGGVIIADADFAHLIEEKDSPDYDPDEYKNSANFPPTLLDWVSLQKGLKIMADKYPRHLSDFINKNDDAETGDVFVQCSVLGNVVFG